MKKSTLAMVTLAAATAFSAPASADEPSVFDITHDNMVCTDDNDGAFSFHMQNYREPIIKLDQSKLDLFSNSATSKVTQDTINKSAMGAFQGVGQIIATIYHNKNLCTLKDASDPTNQPTIIVKKVSQGAANSLRFGVNQ